MDNKNYETMPPHVLANLNLFTKHKDCTCANCKYAGPMGVSKEETDKKMRQWVTRFIIGLVIFSFGINYYYPSSRDSYVPYFLGIPFCIIFIILMPPKFETVSCPNCGLWQIK